MLVSGTQQSDQLYTYIYSFFLFFSIIVYQKILNTVPCAIKQILAVYLIHGSVHSSLFFKSINRRILTIPFDPSSTVE